MRTPAPLLLLTATLPTRRKRMRVRCALVSTLLTRTLHCRDATNDTDSSSDDEMHTQDLSQNKKTNSQKKREHQQKAAQKARDRAKNWNAAHPDLATHLTSLKPRDLRALCKQHGFKRNGDVASPKTAVASELPNSDVKQEKSKKERSDGTRREMESSPSRNQGAVCLCDASECHRHEPEARISRR